MNDMLINDMQLEVYLKGNLDHEDLDKMYQTARMKRDSQMTAEFERLRTAKENLAKFEKEMDNDLPESKKLREFHAVAKEVIDNDPYKRGSTRTPEEEELLKEKMRRMEKEKGIDLTELFESEPAERARKSIHKKAFASYRAFEFLKGGITKKKEEEKKKDSQYEYPPWEYTV